MEIVTLPAQRAEDILSVRSASRAITAFFGLDEPDQVRFATALSEIGREVVGSCRNNEICFDLETSDPPAITARFVVTPEGTHGLDDALGVNAARRLVDDVTVRGDGPSEIVVKKLLPPWRNPPDVRQIADAVRSAVPPSPFDELWTQNRQLAATLDDLQSKQSDVLRMNTELEETNRGVMAMYGQLTEELEETNRGVVALYAELDDKGLQLREATEAKSRFFAAVSHELRTPVNSVVALAQVLTEPDADPLTSDQRHQVDLIRSAASDLLTLVNQLLDIAKAEAGHLNPQISFVDLPELAYELRGALRPMVRGPVALIVDVEPDLPPVESDRALMAQILRNLMVNAIRFTESGEIRLRARVSEAAQQILLEVSDTGIGIAPEHHERVFDEFFQVRSALQAKSTGTGLGLAHTRRLVDALGGEIRLNSAVSSGSTFTVLLPQQWNPALTHALRPAPKTTAPVASVLIVDDDEGFRTALRGMLQGLSAQVSEASGGEEALRQMATRSPDVVFLDLRMPDLDGAEVLAQMGENPALRDVPVVIVTSVDLALDTQARLTRAHALLAKSAMTREDVQRVLAELKISE